MASVCSESLRPYDPEGFRGNTSAGPKGVVLTWAPVLQGEYLGQAAMAFLALTGTLHLSQLLSDIIELQRRQKRSLWLVSFDVEKCFPSLPWWAIFGVLERAGVPCYIVRYFRCLYSQLRHHFRYGQVH